MAGKLKVRKGDNVIVVAGRDKGKTGSVLRVLRARDRLIVQGVNVVKRHLKPSPSHAGGIEQREAPLHVSNVALVDPKSGKPTRVGYKRLADGRKVRFARRSGEVLDK